ncbi:MAG: HmuY family protein [Sediminibacterium sp.]|nr:HmuY family protein [Sediminibacterium sp.]
MKKSNVKRLQKIFIMVTVLQFIISCSVQVTGPDTIIGNIYREYNNLPADTFIGINSMGRAYGANKFTFFNLDSNKIISSSDSNSNKWDIAFKGTTMILNGGTSGPGKVSGFLQIGIYDTTVNLPKDSTFYVDNGINLALSKYNRFYNYNSIKFTVSPKPGVFFIIRTNQNSLCKLQIYSLYKNKIDLTNPTLFATYGANDLFSISNYYSFQFQLVTNGGTTWPSGGTLN